mmetsp:Transcript_32955/g.38157  ORF Transcript_32955/g.38157 Transcript_32955/m.38157 type:complete len:97 (-) Transcript_32955:400-690(-)
MTMAIPHLTMRTKNSSKDTILYRTLKKKWKVEKPDFRWFLNTKKKGKIRDKLSAISWKNKGEKFDFSKSFYVKDAVFLLLSREDAINGATLLSSHF